ncbi:YncE family protein [Larkinella bovis]|uniref:YncE family protein n=1 Tax=Larkinella bovis TaxID=683041 RepID=A0ABW0I4M3_9BACT
MKKTKTASGVRLKLALGLLVALNWSCDSEKNEPSPVVPFGTSGVLVLNSGNFSDNNGTITYYPSTGSPFSYDFFNRVNQRSLTGSVQGYTESDGKGIILVDNTTGGQDKVEIVDANTFKSLATLKSPDIENPRSAVRVGANKVYVSCWDVSGDFSNGTFYKDPGYVAVVDLTTNKVTKKIPAVKGVETLLLVGTEVFAGSSGDATRLTVIDTATDQVKTGIEVGANPNPVAFDANGKLWVLSGHELVRINPQSKTVENRLTIGTDKSRSLSHFVLSADKQSIYFISSFYDAADNYREKGELHRFALTDTSIPATTPFISKLFSGLAVDPQSGILYGGFTPSYKQAGYVFRYQPNGTLIDSVKAEIAPTGFFFK